MVLEDMSWHLKYYEYSFMYYIGGCFGLVMFYVLLYCFKVPVNRIPNLQDVIDNDPTINEGLFEIVRLGEEEDANIQKRFYSGMDSARYTGNRSKRGPTRSPLSPRVDSKSDSRSTLTPKPGTAVASGAPATAEYCIVSQQDKIFHVKMSHSDMGGLADTENRDLSDDDGGGSEGHSFRMDEHTVCTVVERDPAWVAALRRGARLRSITKEDINGEEEGDEANEDENAAEDTELLSRGSSHHRLRPTSFCRSASASLSSASSYSRRSNSMRLRVNKMHDEISLD